MRWLVTVQKSADLNKLMKVIQGYGGEQDHDNLPIPLGDTELLIQINGPSYLAETLKSVSEIVDIYPDSEMQLY